MQSRFDLHTAKLTGILKIIVEQDFICGYYYYYNMIKSDTVSLFTTVLYGNFQNTSSNSHTVRLLILYQLQMK